MLWTDVAVRLFRRFWFAIPILLLTAALLLTRARLDDVKQNLALSRQQTLTAVERHRAFAHQVAATSQRIRADMLANARRVETAQNAITEEVTRDYEARIADLRRRAERLRQARAPAAGPGGGGASLPGAGSAAGGPDGGAADNGLSLEQRIVATEQAIQLDELQRWIRRQLAVPR